MQRRIRRFLTRSLVLLSIALLLTGAVSLTGGVDVPQGTQPTAIGECTTITAPGQYRLASDLRASGEGPCLSVTANNVTLLGAGQEIRGNGSGTGVLVQPAGSTDRLENVTVRNLTVGEFDTGVLYRGGVATGTVANVTAAGNREGIVVDPRFRVRAADGTLTLRNNVARSNDRAGIALRANAEGDSLVGNRLRNNQHGLAIQDAAGLRVRDTIARNNSVGVGLLDVSRSRFVNTTTRANARIGFRAGNGFDDNRLEMTRAVGNGADGIHVGPGTNTTFRNTTASENGGNGISFLDTGAVRFERLRTTGNDRYGLAFEAVNGVRLVDVVAGENQLGLYTATMTRNTSIMRLRQLESAAR